jgi:hypothetical protein
LVQRLPLRAHVLDQPADPWADRGVVLWLRQGREILLQLAPPLRDGDATLQQNGTQLVDQRRSLTYQTLTGAVQDLQVEEPWPRLGDGGLRKAAYRGGWKPA